MQAAVGGLASELADLRRRVAAAAEAAAAAAADAAEAAAALAGHEPGMGPQSLQCGVADGTALVPVRRTAGPYQGCEPDGVAAELAALRAAAAAGAGRAPRGGAAGCDGRADRRARGGAAQGPGAPAQGPGGGGCARCRERPAGAAAAFWRLAARGVDEREAWCRVLRRQRRWRAVRCGSPPWRGAAAVLCRCMIMPSPSLRMAYALCCVVPWCRLACPVRRAN